MQLYHIIKRINPLTATFACYKITSLVAENSVKSSFYYLSVFRVHIYSKGFKTNYYLSKLKYYIINLIKEIGSLI